MRKLFISGLLMILPLLAVFAQQVVISPEYPQAGNEVSVVYTPVSSLADVPAATMIFSTSNFYNLAYKMKMTKSGGQRKTAFVLPAYAAYASFYIQCGDSIIRPAADRH